MLHDDDARARTFGDVAERYDRVRPGYPDALIDALLAGGPAPGCSVLDVGCGTGIAARALEARGCGVLGVEPDARMAAVARRHGTTVELSRFEDWERAGRQFDLVVSAHAWHWVEPVSGAALAADALAGDGHIGLFWNLGVLPADLKADLDAVYERLAPGVDRYSVVLGNAGIERVEEAATGLGASGRFGPVEIVSFPHVVTYTTADWLEQLPTHSDHRSLEPGLTGRLFDAIAAVIDRRGGVFDVRYDATLLRAGLGGT